MIFEIIPTSRCARTDVHHLNRLASSGNIEIGFQSTRKMVLVATSVFARHEPDIQKPPPNAAKPSSLSAASTINLTSNDSIFLRLFLWKKAETRMPVWSSGGKNCRARRSSTFADLPISSCQSIASSPGDFPLSLVMFRRSAERKWLYLLILVFERFRPNRAPFAAESWR